jgi:hypothetical protein
LSSSHEDDVGQREGRGAEDNDDDCGRRGRVVVVLEGRGKRIGEKGGWGMTDDGERGAHCQVFRFCWLRSGFKPGSVKPPLPRA